MLRGIVDPSGAAPSAVILAPQCMASGPCETLDAAPEKTFDVQDSLQDLASPHRTFPAMGFP